MYIYITLATDQVMFALNGCPFCNRAGKKFYHKNIYLNFKTAVSYENKA